MSQSMRPMAARTTITTLVDTTNGLKRPWVA